MDQPEPTPTMATHWIVWAAMLATLVSYAAIPFFVAGADSHDPLLEQAMLLNLFGVSLASAIGTLVARHIMLVTPARRGELDLGSAPARSRFFSASVAFWTIAESIGIYGLVLYILFGKPAYLNAFLLAAAILLAVHSPRVPAEASS